MTYQFGQTWSITGFVYIIGLEQKHVFKISILTMLWLPSQCNLGVYKLDSFWKKLN